MKIFITLILFILIFIKDYTSALLLISAYILTYTKYTILTEGLAMKTSTGNPSMYNYDNQEEEENVERMVDFLEFGDKPIPGGRMPLSDISPNSSQENSQDSPVGKAYVTKESHINGIYDPLNGYLAFEQVEVVPP
jgi:hypothetical protein